MTFLDVLKVLYIVTYNFKMVRKTRKQKKIPSPSPEPDAVPLSASEEEEIVEPTPGLRRSPRKRHGHSSVDKVSIVKSPL